MVTAIVWISVYWLVLLAYGEMREYFSKVHPDRANNTATQLHLHSPAGTYERIPDHRVWDDRIGRYRNRAIEGGN